MSRFQVGGWAGILRKIPVAVTLVQLLLLTQHERAFPQSLKNLDLYGDVIPYGAALRLGSERFHRHQNVQCAAVLPDNETLLVVGDELVYYELPSGKLLRKLPIRIREFHNQQSVFTPDNKLVGVTGFQYDKQNAQSFRHVKLLEAETGLERFSYSTTGRMEEEGLVVSPDGSTIAKIGRTAHIWDVASGEEILKYELEAVGRGAVAEFSPDGETLAIAVRNAVLLWNWSGGNEPVSISLSPGSKRVEPLSFAFSADGDELYVGSESDSGVIHIDTRTISVVGTFSYGTDPTYVSLSDLQLSRDGKQLASVGERNSAPVAMFWDLESKTLSKQLKGSVDAMRQVSYSPNGKYLTMVAGWSNLLEVYDIEAGKQITGDFNNHRLGVNFLAFVPGKNLLASASDDGSLRVWDLETCKLTLQMQDTSNEDANTRWIRAAAVAPNGEFYATSSLDNTVRVWKAASGEQLYELAGHGRLGGRRSLCFSPDSKQLHSFGDDSRVYTYSVATGKAISEYKLELPEFRQTRNPFGVSSGISFALNSNEYSQDGSLLVLGVGAIVLVDGKTGKEKLRIPADSTQSSVRETILSPDKKHLLQGAIGPRTQTKLKSGGTRISAGENHIIRLYSAEDGTLLAERQFDNSRTGPMAFSPDGRFAAVASDERKTKKSVIRIFRTSDLAEFRSIVDLESGPRKLAFSHDGTRLAAALDDTTILVWDLDQL